MKKRTVQKTSTSHLPLAERRVADARARGDQVLDQVDDSKGRSISVGDRVYIPPRSFSRPDFRDDGSEILLPGERGRVYLITVEHGRTLVHFHRTNSGASSAAPADACRRQYGRTSSEKAHEGAVDRGLRGALA